MAGTAVEAPPMAFLRLNCADAGIAAKAQTIAMNKRVVFLFIMED